MSSDIESTYKKQNDEVFYSKKDIVSFNALDIDFLLNKMSASVNKRARLCAHKTADDLLHEMIIAIQKGSYIRPHKHHGKSESFHVVQGEIEVVIFDDKGSVVEVIPMGDAASGRCFFYRVSDPFYHTLLVQSDHVILHESTNGPFDKSQTQYADFAPAETDKDLALHYLRNLTEIVFSKIKSSGL